MDEAELAAGRVQVGEASILWHNEVDIEVDIEASEGPAVAAWSLLEASRPPVDLSGTCCSGPLSLFQQSHGGRHFQRDCATHAPPQLHACTSANASVN